MAGKIVVLSQELKNRCRTGDHSAVKEAVDTLLSNAQIKLNMAETDHRYAQGYLHSLEGLRDLMSNS